MNRRSAPKPPAPSPSRTDTALWLFEAAMSGLPSLLKSATAAIGPNVPSVSGSPTVPETGIVVMVTASWVTLVWVSTSAQPAVTQRRSTAALYVGGAPKGTTSFRPTTPGATPTVDWLNSGQSSSADFHTLTVAVRPL